jgi:serine/threonine protein kinase
VADLTKKIQAGKWDFPKGSYSRPVKDLITKMLVANPSKRIILEDIGTHEFFAKNKLPTALPSILLKTAPDSKFFQ